MIFEMIMWSFVGMGFVGLGGLIIIDFWLLYTMLREKVGHKQSSSKFGFKCGSLK